MVLFMTVLPSSCAGRMAVASPRSAATSAVMSIPAGHHVMHRPQPTQPIEPNWSCHEPSLWLIHWR